MLSVIITILKLIGLLLLGILGLILLVVLAVLLVPIRYQAEAAMEEKKPRVKARVSWLLRFICVRVRYEEDGLHYQVKICGFSLLDSDQPKPVKEAKPKAEKKTQKKKRKPPKKAAKSAKPRKPAGQTKPVEGTSSAVTAEKKPVQTVVQEQAAPKPETPKEETVKAEMKKEPTPVQPSMNSAAKTQEEAAGGKETKEKKSLQQKLQDLNTKKDEIQQKIHEIKAKVDEVLNYLQSPRGKKLMIFLKKKFFRLMRHLKPKALRINGRLGLKNPATTGQILGIAYMLYPLYEENIQLRGEFEEEVIEGDLFIKGRIRLGTLLLIALQIIINKEVRMWIKKATGGKRK